jgi:eukaryotic-like serine/threonine-protein kinase
MSNFSIGSLIANRYEIVSEVGEGGMGIVYRAHDRLRDTIVALKCLLRTNAQSDVTRASAGEDSDGRLSIATEFKTVASLHHPHIISVLDYGFDEQQPFFTMELLEDAQTILEYAQGETTAEKMRLVIELLQALRYLHRYHIIHRDLKPSNILVDANGRVKVLDFGLAVESRYQGTGLAGSFQYMAPEMIQNLPVSEATDLYAVGVLSYQIFTESHPFNTSDINRLLQSILTELPSLIGLEAVVGPGVAAVIGRLLAKNPLDRYQWASTTMNELRLATGLDRPDEDRDLRESYLQSAPFIGRTAELSRLEEALGNALRGRGSAWLVGGEAGVGKSRLLEEVRIRALVKGMIVLRGQATEGRPVSFQLWRDVLPPLLLTTQITDLEASVLKVAVPHIESLLRRPVPDLPSIDPNTIQQRLSRTIVNVFRRQHEPIFIILEDLHWADESLVILREVCRIVPNLPLLVVGSYRTDADLYFFSKFPDMQPVMVNRLDADEMTALSEAMLGTVGTRPDVISLLRRETEGNVLFAVEVLRTLADEAGSLDAIGNINLPQHVFADGMRVIMERRLQRLPQDYRPMLRLAAVAGREIDFAILKYVDDEMDYDDWLSVCAGAAILEVNDGLWRFTHDKLREGILNGLSSTERPRLHGIVAEALEAVYPDDHLTRAMTVADHWLEAGELDPALWHMSVGARQLIDWGKEVSKVRKVLQDAWEVTSRPGVTKPAYFREDILEMLGDLEMQQGNGTHAQMHFVQALNSARQQEHNLTITRLLAKVADLAYQKEEFAESINLAQESLELSRKQQDQEGEARALRVLGLALGGEGNPEQGTDYLEQSYRIYHHLNENYAMARVLESLGTLNQQQRDYVAANDFFQQTAMIHEAMGNERGLGVALVKLGALAVLQEDFNSAEEYYQQGLEICRRLGERLTQTKALDGLAVIFHRRGDATTAQNYARESTVIKRELKDSGVLSTAELNAIKL